MSNYSNAQLDSLDSSNMPHLLINIHNDVELLLGNTYFITLDKFPALYENVIKKKLIDADSDQTIRRKSWCNTYVIVPNKTDINTRLQIVIRMKGNNFYLQNIYRVNSNGEKVFNMDDYIQECIWVAEKRKCNKDFPKNNLDDLAPDANWINEILSKRQLPNIFMATNHSSDGLSLLEANRYCSLDKFYPQLYDLIKEKVFVRSSRSYYIYVMVPNKIRVDNTDRFKVFRDEDDNLYYTYRGENKKPFEIRSIIEDCLNVHDKLLVADSLY